MIVVKPKINDKNSQNISCIYGSNYRVKPRLFVETLNINDGSRFSKL